MDNTNMNPSRAEDSRPNTFEHFSPHPTAQQNNTDNEQAVESEPVLDEQDMEENNLKDEDLDKIEWDEPEQPDEETETSTNDITD